MTPTKATSTISRFDKDHWKVHDRSTKLMAWATLGLIAVGGSLLYGASLSFVLPGWQGLGSAAWLSVSAGLGWCVFLPGLWNATKQPLSDCIRLCLVTMAYGEAVLITGAVGNWLLAFRPIVNPAAFNIACVTLSNFAMALAITRQMTKLAVPTWKTLALWMVALNGSGAMFFYLFRFLLEVHP